METRLLTSVGGGVFSGRHSGDSQDKELSRYFTLCTPKAVAASALRPRVCVHV